MEKRAPRLQFTDEKCGDPVLKKPIRRVQKAAARADRAWEKIPKKTVKTRERVVDPATGKVTTRLKFEETARKKPPSKLTHAVRDAPVNAALSQFHREIRQFEDDNVGVEAAHKSEDTAELSVRAGQSAYRSHKLKPYRKSAKAESRLDRANLGYLQKKVARDAPRPSGNPLSHWRQKRAVKKQYAAAKRTGRFMGSAGNTVKAGKTVARESKRAAAFVGRHNKGFLIVAAVFMVLALFLNAISSCPVLLEGGLSGVVVSTYPSSDEAMLGAEAAYAAMEADLQNEVDNYETLYPGYDEYRYDLDKIGHDPYVLSSILTAWHGGEWTLAEVQDTLSVLFSKQYELTQTVITETNGETSYTVCTVTLHNENLSHLPVFIMDEDTHLLFDARCGSYACHIVRIQAADYKH